MKNIVIWMAISYLIGSFPTGYFLVRLIKGQDIRTLGSGNIGATNVRRVLGRGWAVFVTVIDMLKGALPLLFTATMFSMEPMMLSLSGMSAVVGHNFPLWLKFRGGKGVATTYGVVFFLWPPYSCAVALLSGAIWYAVMKTTRYVSLASMISLLAMPCFFWMLGAPLPFIVVSLALGLFVLYRHGTNITRLLQGKENKI